MTSKNVLVAAIALVLGIAGPVAVLIAANQARQTALLVAFGFICLAVVGVIVAAALCGDREEPDYDEPPLAEVEQKCDGERDREPMRFSREPRPQLRLGLH